MKKIITLLSFACLLLVNQAFAKKETYPSTAIVTGTGWYNLPYSFQNAVPYPPVNFFMGFSTLHYRTKALNSYVKFWLKTDNIPAGLTAFTAQVNLQITYYLEDPNGSIILTGIVVAKTLTINYDHTTGVGYKNADLANFPGASRIDVSVVSMKINGVAASTATALQNSFIALQSYIEHERYYNYQNIFGNNTLVPSLPLPVAVYDAPNNEMTISWNAEVYAEGYELEYTFVDDYSNIDPNVTFVPSSQLNFSFKNNSTRILLEGTSYTMPLVQEHGYLLFRVRGYGMAGTDFERIFFGLWDATVDGDQTFTVSTYPYKFAITNFNRQVGDKMNWQSVTSFAEEGKSKTVVKYFDGTLRPRQTVTNTSTERNAVIAETIYDYQGRPAVNTLPAPVDNAIISYYRKFNQNMAGQTYSYADFDRKGPTACAPSVVAPMKQQGSIGAANYYSQYNPNKTGFNAYIPEANGYPFTKVVYMPDATERVVRHGNVGETFQPGNTGVNGTVAYQNHDTKYYYGKPEQDKLDYLFGTDVGYAAYYQKNLVLDPNGQASVSYVDLDGKTIATALAGEAPAGIEPLKSRQTLSIQENLLAKSDVVNKQDHSITNSQSFLVTGNKTTYKFTYAIQPNSFKALSCSTQNYCLDCIYNIEINLVKDECGEPVYTFKKTLGKLADLNFTCGDASTAEQLTFTQLLDIGSYTITKKLTVNKEAAAKYADSIINDPSNTCLKTFDDFYEAAWNNRDTMRCKEACDACQAEAKAAETASLMADAVRECDKQWCKPELSTMCDVAQMSMINDLRPGGQYALYKDGDGNIDRNASPISIFNQETQVGIKRIMSDANIAAINIEFPGEPTRALSYYLGSNALFTQLVNNWPEDLSEQLLPLHPEYCYLQFCNQSYMDLSNSFDTKFMSAETLDDAKTALGTTAVDATHINAFYTLDPFYNNLPAVLKAAMQQKISNYTGQGHSIKQLALFMANCPAGNDLNNCAGAWDDVINDDEEWETFQNIYFSIKQEFIQKAREYYVRKTANCCPNDYINCANDAAYCPPIIMDFSNFGTINTTYPCFPNITTAQVGIIRIFYQDAKRRFTTINDIDFPAMPNPAQSLYEMAPKDLVNQLQSDSLQPPCPTCPELDAFKMMLWYIQDKGWITNGATVPADAIAGLKDSLRSRILGTQKNETITISATKNGGFSISSNKCTISISSDTVIDWKEAELLPTCLAIQDYRHAKLHVMVDGAYKTVLNISSTCDLFYCEGKAPTAPPVDNRCKCDSMYNKGKPYQLGNIVRFGGTCYIARKAEANGKIPLGSSPGQNDYWSKVCDMDTVVCGNMFNLNFNSPAIFETDLRPAAQTLLNPGEYTVQSSYPVNNTVLASKALITRPNSNRQVLVAKTVAVQPNKQYMISFEARVLIDRTSTVTLSVNGRSLKSYTIKWKKPKSFAFTWTNTSNTTATVGILCAQFSKGSPDLIAIDNFGMQCLDNNVGIGNSVHTSGGNGVAIKDTSFASRPKPIDPLKPPPNRYIPPNACGCNGLCDAELPSPEMPIIPCDSIQKELAEQQATEAYNDYRDSVFKALLEGYYEKCMQSLESFSMEYQDAEYHYTLYYYDQSGNLVRTVPPAGVKPLTNADLPLVRNGRNSNGPPKIPAHILHSTYQHNSLNAVVKQQTPDAGTATFFYDALGRIALNQNAKQQPTNTASYTTYDPLGRTEEVGVIDVNGAGSLKARAYAYYNWTSFVNSRGRTEITKTFYNKPYLHKINIAFGSNGQQNLRNRIGTVAWFAKDADLSAFNYQHATHYSYDIAGNVTTLLQDFGTASDFGSNPANVRTQSKKIDYRFDLVSGKVNEVHYQQGYTDQFMYKYEYNADNKLTKAFSSANGLVWENDARYYYYRHGPLARTELGSDKVQGSDYAYTLQGWMKGVNGISNNPKEDMGQDGRQTTVGPSNIGYQLQNRATAPDVYSYWLGYYQADYKAIGSVGSPTVANTIAPLHSGLYHSGPAQLFNGNIRSMYTNIQPFGGLGMWYSYDQLNRIKKQTGFDLATNAPLPNSAYTMALAYDPNGNIQKLLRNGTVATPAMDDLQYHYYTSAGSTYTGDPTAIDATNKLAYVTDAVGTTAEPSDIESQPANNYAYDAIGNLITDAQEGLSIRWNVQNKITYIKKANGNDIAYSYDALGNRIKKTVLNTTPGGSPGTQYYVRDAQGNTMAIYEMKNNAMHWAEQHLYGSSRLGIYQPNLKLALPLQPLPPLTALSTTRHSTQYELTNHLGNVLATVSDGRSSSNTATILTATDYYAFGMGMQRRGFSLNNSGYRYGMNGQEKSNEIFDNLFGAEYWEYDSRIGRRWNIDPIITVGESEYACFKNNPIYYIDTEGDKPHSPFPKFKGSRSIGGYIRDLLNWAFLNKRTHFRLGRIKKQQVETKIITTDIVKNQSGGMNGTPNVSDNYNLSTVNFGIIARNVAWRNLTGWNTSITNFRTLGRSSDSGDPNAGTTYTLIDNSNGQSSPAVIVMPNADSTARWQNIGTIPGTLSVTDNLTMNILNGVTTSGAYDGCVQYIIRIRITSTRLSNGISANAASRRAKRRIWLF